MISHIKEFEYYYKQGGGRSYKATATKYKVSPRTVESWAKKEGWKEEIKKRDGLVVERNRDDILRDRQKEVVDSQKIISESIEKYLVKLKNGEIDIGVKDYVSLVKLNCYLNDYLIKGLDMLNSDGENNGLENIEDSDIEKDVLFYISRSIFTLGEKITISGNCSLYNTNTKKFESVDDMTEYNGVPFGFGLELDMGTKWKEKIFYGDYVEYKGKKYKTEYKDIIWSIYGENKDNEDNEEING